MLWTQIEYKWTEVTSRMRHDIRRASKKDAPTVPLNHDQVAQDPMDVAAAGNGNLANTVHGN